MAAKREKSMTAEPAPIGHSCLMQELKLRALAPAHQSFIVRRVRRSEVHDGKTIELYSSQYAVEADPVSHLRFAFKHEPLDLGVIVAALRLIGKKPLENRGELSKTKRAHFAELSDDEIARLEAAIQRAVDEAG